MNHDGGQMSRHVKQAEIFRGLLAPHTSMLYKVALRLAGRSDGAEDLVQDLLVKLYPKTEEMQRIELLSPWLKKALYRLFIDKQRKRARRPRISDNRDPESGDMHTQNPDPETLVRRAEDWQRLRAALDKLGPENRSLVLMHLVEGYSLAELEEIFGVSSQTLKTRLRRAKTSLKKILTS